jgi:hypothetical protein
VSDAARGGRVRTSVRSNFVCFEPERHTAKRRAGAGARGRGASQRFSERFTLGLAARSSAQDRVIRDFEIPLSDVLGKLPQV